MLQTLLTLCTILLALAAFSVNKASAVLLLLIAFGYVLTKHPHYRHILEKQLLNLSARLTQILAAVVLFGTGVMISTQTPYAIGGYCIVALAIGLLPLAAPFVLRGNVATSASKLNQHRSIIMLRCLLTACSTEVLLVGLSLLDYVFLQLQPVITLPQLLAVEFLGLALPLRALQYDKAHHKLLQVSARNLHSHTLSVAALRNYLNFAWPAAAAVNFSYLFVFARNHLSPRAIDPALPLHRQATTLAMLTLVVCLFAAILFERLDRHEEFVDPYLLQNKKLLRAFGISLLLLAVIIYTPGVGKLFQTAPLDPLDWLAALLLAISYAVSRLLQRHTRKHTRHAVVRLHQEIL